MILTTSYINVLVNINNTITIYSIKIIRIICKYGLLFLLKSPLNILALNGIIMGSTSPRCPLQAFTDFLRTFYEPFTKFLRRFFTMGFIKHFENFVGGILSTLIFHNVKYFSTSKISQGVFQA